MEKPTNIVIVPSPGFSHLLSLLEFSKRLIRLSNSLHITFLIPTLDSPPELSKSYLQTLPSTITTKKAKISEGNFERENMKSLSNSVIKFCDQRICEEIYFFRH
jgi:hypothetical protein